MGQILAMKFRHGLVAFILLLTGCVSGKPQLPRPSIETAPKPYTRVMHSPSGDAQLQVALRRFAPERGRGPEIWLAGVMHIGEPAYYQALQGELSHRTVVLYEGVNAGTHKRRAGNATANLETKEPDIKASSKNGTGYSVQSKLASSLGLVFQLEAIDYHRTNFLNSDLSIAELQKIIADGESNSTGKQSGSSESFEQLLRVMDGNSFIGSLVRLGLEFIASSTELQALTKLTLIETIGGLKGDLSDMRSLPPEMKKLVKVLIEARNERVVSDLKLQLKGLKRRGDSIAIFYGAGHMDNMEKLLAKELHYYPVDELWLNAFSVDLKKSGVSESEARATRSMVEWQLKGLQGK